jgi:hypothetical protein
MDDQEYEDPSLTNVDDEDEELDEEEFGEDQEEETF